MTDVFTFDFLSMKIDNTIYSYITFTNCTSFSMQILGINSSDNNWNATRPIKTSCHTHNELVIKYFHPQVFCFSCHQEWREPISICPMLEFQSRKSNHSFFFKSGNFPWMNGCWSFIQPDNSSEFYPKQLE